MKYLKTLILIVVAIAVASVINFFLKEEQPASKPVAFTDTIKNLFTEEPSNSAETKPFSAEDINKIAHDEQKESLEIAKQFVMAYFTYDSTKPFLNIENAKKYMSQKYWNEISKTPPRENKDLQSRQLTVIDSQIINDGDLANKVKWCIIIEATEKKLKDNSLLEYKREYWYTVYLKKSENKWVVEGVNVEHGQ